jgi:hypothetical protein
MWTTRSARVMDTCLMRSNNDTALRHRPRQPLRERAHAQNMCIFFAILPTARHSEPFRSAVSAFPRIPAPVCNLSPIPSPPLNADHAPSAEIPRSLVLAITPSAITTNETGLLGSPSLTPHQAPRGGTRRAPQSAAAGVLPAQSRALIPQTQPFVRFAFCFSRNRSRPPASKLGSGTRVHRPKGDRPCG